MYSVIDQNLRKKIIYQSQHRGCKEADILYGTFVEKYLDKLSDEELKLYLGLLKENDLDVLQWVLYDYKFPTKYELIKDKLLNAIK
jgi:antitoxin CptB